MTKFERAVINAAVEYIALRDKQVKDYGLAARHSSSQGQRLNRAVHEYNEAKKLEPI